ncbi:hypothetical protein VTK73DRAFT_7148 [Phialemonium thermophilum]|uniref:Uncharacterized protein n=1 Tax=Phialemonium thermophilum TaxID=223376 RepID=A0ABR3WG31_9PEZI
MMDQPFQFIDATNIDERTRKQIRRHVMKGKNAGRRICRPSRLATTGRLASDQLLVGNPSPSSEKGAAQTLGQACVATMASISNGSVLSMPFPVALSPSMQAAFGRFFHFVVEKIYPAHLGLCHCSVLSVWLRDMFSDEAAAHCAVTLMDACNELCLGEAYSSLESLHHLSLAIRLVNKRLAGDDALADSTLTLVMMLILQEQIRKGMFEADIHFEGLKKLVELRGGIEKLETNLPLVLKICKIDICYCLQWAKPLTFFRDRMCHVRDALAASGHSLDPEAAISTIRHAGLDAGLYALLVDVVDVCKVFNAILPGRTMETTTFQEMLISILSRLNRFCPLHTWQGSADGTNTEATYHIGLTIFAMSLFLQYDSRRAVRYETVFVRLRNVVCHRKEGVDDDLRLWAVVMGGIWAAHDENWTWLVSEIVAVCARLKLSSWEEMRGVVQRYPWITVFHDPLGQAVWNRVSRDTTGLSESSFMSS